MDPSVSVRHRLSPSRPSSAALVAGILALFLITPSGAQEGSAKPGTRVLASSPEAVRFTLVDLDPVWTPVRASAGDEPRFRLTVPGMSTGGEPGHPAVPATGGWVVVPPGTRPEIVAVEESWQDAGGRLLDVEPVPVILEGDDPGDRSAGAVPVDPTGPIPEGLEIPEAALPSLATRNAGRRGPAATLGDVSWWRGRRIVSYSIVPVRHDGAGRASEVLTRGTWEIRFLADPAAPVPPGDHGRKSSGRGDERFGSIFLNPGLLRSQPTEGAWRGTTPDRAAGAAEGARNKRAGTPLGPEARIPVWRTGLVRVTYDRLRTRGLLPEGTIQEDQVRLYQRRYLPRLDDGSGQPPFVEIEVPIHIVGEGDAFDGDDFFVFYGLRLRDDTEFTADVGAGPETIPGCGDEREWDNEANFYWLAASEPDPGDAWARMATTTLPAAAGPPLTSYRRSDHYEEQKGFREHVPTVSSDRLYYNFYRDSEVTAGISPLWSPDPAGADATLEIGYAGYNSIDRTILAEWILDADVPRELETFTVSTNYDSTRAYSLPAAELDGLNAKVRLTNPTPVAFLWTHLNWVKLSYDARYEAVDDRLEFHGGEGAGVRPVEVTGFGGADLGLVEITDPRKPVLVALAPENVVADAGGWKLSIQFDQADFPRRFAVEGDFSADGVPEFPSFLSSVADNPAVPTAVAGPDPDLIVITHREFRGALDRLLEHRDRRSRGQLAIHVVDVQDLYDWYGGGLKTDRAIKRFTTQAMTRWNSWSLLIVGDANENALEKGVLSGARTWSADWVPTHYHVQRALSFNPELMASDKWFTTLESSSEDDPSVFPRDVLGPWGMYTGRLPCNSVAELDNMIDKIITVENVQAGQEWRRRGIFMADDQWSNGYGVAALTQLVYNFGERVFTNSMRDSVATLWRDATGVTLEDDLILLETYLDPLYPYDPPPPNPPARPLLEVRDDTALYATGPLLGALNRGGLLAIYQGHANPYVLSSEHWLDDSRLPLRRRDVNLMSNTDKPWLFIGLGCHISDWAQSTYRSETVSNEQSLSEKMHVRAGSGASASYGSSGYEYITENRLFSEYIIRRWTRNPPAAVLGDGEPGRSRWIAGELMWAAEADIFAVRRDRIVQEMVSQYVYLGDPLMALDAGEPVVTAILRGETDQEIEGEFDLVALDAGNVRTVDITARDEAGIDRIRVVASDGTDLTSQIVTETLPPGATNHQRVDYSLAVPIRPFDHSITVEIHDTAGRLDTDRHYSLVLNLPQEAVFSSGGQVVDPATFVFPAETPVRFNTVVASAAWLSEAMPKSLTSETLELTDVVFTLDKTLGMTVDFTATATAENPAEEHKVVLTLDGFSTEWVLQQGAGSGPVATIGKVYNYPNPMTEATRFVFESGAAGVEGIIRVFSVAGRTVAHIPFRYGGGGQGVVEWDGRDDAGDAMANGTYLYRVELETDQGRIASPMQRLVMMR